MIRMMNTKITAACHAQKKEHNATDMRMRERERVGKIASLKIFLMRIVVIIIIKMGLVTRAVFTLCRCYLCSCFLDGMNRDRWLLRFVGNAHFVWSSFFLHAYKFRLATNHDFLTLLPSTFKIIFVWSTTLTPLNREKNPPCCDTLPLKFKVLTLWNWLSNLK